MFLACVKMIHNAIRRPFEWWFWTVTALLFNIFLIVGLTCLLFRFRITIPHQQEQHVSETIERKQIMGNRKNREMLTSFFSVLYNTAV